MRPFPKRSVLGPCIAAGLLALSLGGCGRHDDPAAATASLPTAGTVPPPPGDATPRPADSDSRKAMEGHNEKTGDSGTQTTVGTAASGAPPYTVNGAPEGNAAPQQGSKAGEPAKK